MAKRRSRTLKRKVRRSKTRTYRKRKSHKKTRKRKSLGKKRRRKTLAKKRRRSKRKRTRRRKIRIRGGAETKEGGLPLWATESRRPLAKKTLQEDAIESMVIMTDLPMMGMEHGDVDDIAALLFAVYHLWKGKVHKLKIVFCEDGAERLKKFKEATKSPFDIYSTIYNSPLVQSGELIFVSEENFEPNMLDYILVHSPIMVSTVKKFHTIFQDLDKCSNNLAFQGKEEGDYNIDKTIEKIIKSDFETKEADDLMSWFINAAKKYGNSSKMTGKKFKMNQFSINHPLSNSVRDFFVGKMVGMAFGLSGYVADRMDGFYFPSIPNKGNNFPEIEVYKTLLSDDLVTKATNGVNKGNNLKPWVKLYSQLGTIEGAIKKFNEIKLDESAVEVIDNLGSAQINNNGKTMFKFLVARMGQLMYGKKFINDLFNNKTGGTNKWISIVEKKPNTHLADNTAIAKKVEETFLQDTPALWDLINTGICLGYDASSHEHIFREFLTALQ